MGENEAFKKMHEQWKINHDQIQKEVNKMKDAFVLYGQQGMRWGLMDLTVEELRKTLGKSTSSLKENYRSFQKKIAALKCKNKKRCLRVELESI